MIYLASIEPGHNRPGVLYGPGIRTPSAFSLGRPQNLHVFILYGRSRKLRRGPDLSRVQPRRARTQQERLYVRRGWISGGVVGVWRISSFRRHKPAIYL